MESDLSRLKIVLAEITDLYNVAGLLGWDQQTCMPPGGAEQRGYQLSTLKTLAHVRFTSLEVGQLLDAAEPMLDTLDPSSDDACLIRVTRRRYEKRIKVPPTLVSEMAQASAAAHQAWEKARLDSDFWQFLPHLEKIVDLKRRYSNFFAPFEHAYDPLLDDYEPGMKTSEVKAIFNVLRPQQVALLREIMHKTEPEDAFLHLNYDPQKQWDFGVEVISRFGYDWKRGRQDRSTHPFTESLGRGDVRITTRIYPDFLSSALFSTMHEAGHAIYEQGVDSSLARSPLDGGASLALHESQSRMWENLIGRSLPFWQHFYPDLQEVFPEQLAKVSLERFYWGINKVKPSLIRVEADEATYNLHIMLRLEIEIGLIEGTIEVKDLPEIWNEKMHEYLDIVPPDDAKGVLQDIHWSSGLLGYFSTYALGNLIAAQVWERVNEDLPGLESQIRSGDFSELLGWLQEKIHRHGAKFEPQDLVQRVTGSWITPEPYLNYLRTKYGTIYGL